MIHFIQDILNVNIINVGLGSINYGKMEETLVRVSSTTPSSLPTPVPSFAPTTAPTTIVSIVTVTQVSNNYTILRQKIL
jgi:hypothetical protein